MHRGPRQVELLTGNLAGRPSFASQPMSAILLVVYFTALVVLAVLGLHRLAMAIVAWRARSERPEPSAPSAEAPTVLVQLPLYNESLVANLLPQRRAYMFERDRLSAIR